MSEIVCRYCANVRESCKCPRFKTNQMRSGEWTQPVRRGYTMRCCDCGLAHLMDFRVRRGRAQFRAFRGDGI